MLQLIILCLALIVAIIRGGRVIKLPEFKMPWLLVFPIVIEAGAIVLPNQAPLLSSISYVFIIGFLAMNWSIPEIRLTLIGVSMNALVIWVNGGTMPVAHYISYLSPKSIPAYDYNEFWHTSLTKNTVFPLLSDIIYLHYPIPTFLSCGDVFLFGGISLLIQRLLGVPVKLAKLAGSK